METPFPSWNWRKQEKFPAWKYEPWPQIGNISNTWKLCLQAPFILLCLPFSHFGGNAFFTNWSFAATLCGAGTYASFSYSVGSLHISVSHFDNSCNISGFFIIIIFVMIVCKQTSLMLLLQFGGGGVPQTTPIVFFRHNAIALCSINITFVCTGKPKFPFDSLCCDMYFIMAVWNPTSSNPWGMPIIWIAVIPSDLVALH